MLHPPAWLMSSSSIYPKTSTLYSFDSTISPRNLLCKPPRDIAQSHLSQTTNKQTSMSWYLKITYAPKNNEAGNVRYNTTGADTAPLKQNSSHRSCTHPSVFLPVHSLVFNRAVLHQLTLATRLPSILDQRVSAFRAGLRTFAVGAGRLLFAEGYITVDPVAHFPGLYPSTELLSSFDIEDSRTFDTASWKSNHFAVVHAAEIWTATRIIVEYFFRWHEQRMGEQNLRI